jgi:predicted Fe-Mo cluster-binding NifX family protein
MTRIAIPTSDGRLDPHFGHCQTFVFLTRSGADAALTRQELPAPAHQPGLLPRWLKEQGATVVIAGGMGARAVDLLRGAGIQVILGASSQTPEELATAFLAGRLTDAGGICTQHRGTCQH